MKNSSYKVIVSEDKSFFEERIEKLLNEGFKLAGGVSITEVEDKDGFIATWYHQAVVKISD